jgi:hypothetical protein
MGRTGRSGRAIKLTMWRGIRLPPLRHTNFRAGEADALVWSEERPVARWARAATNAETALTASEDDDRGTGAARAKTATTEERRG